MKLPKIPDDGQPKSLKQTIHASTPIVLTVMATLLAGLSSGEMTRSQYFRSLAAQFQAKASDQWAFYQAKRSRSVEAANALDILSAASHPAPLDPAGLLAADADLHPVLDDPATAALFAGGFPQLPAVEDKPVADKTVSDAMAAADHGQTEAQMAPLLRQITDDQMAAALQTAQANLDAFDAAMQPIGTAMDKLHSTLGQAGSNTPAVFAAQADVSAARLRYSSVRYDREAGYNRVTGELYDLQVHRNSVESDRRRTRSSLFFYGMLISQAAVLIATFSLAGQKPGALWMLAVLTGAAAAAFGGYVYIYF